MSGRPQVQIYSTPGQASTSPTSERGNDIVSEGSFPRLTTSPYFPPGFHDFLYDLVVLSEDSVLFYLQTDVLRRVSGEVFQSVIAQPCILVEGHPEPLRRIPDTSDVFNLILHAVYFLPFNERSCPFQTFADAVSAMRRYNIEPRLHLTPSNPFYINLLSFAPVVPYELYALAAQFDIYHLAAAASSHLLSRPLTAIGDELAERIGGVYLKRLLLLHRERMDALKALLLQPPDPHPPTDTCNQEGQTQLTSSWAMVAANLAWAARPDLSTSMISSAFSHLNGTFSCHLCRQILDDRVQDIVTRWSNVKVRVSLG